MNSFKPLLGPIKSNDIDYMYNYCKKRIQNATKTDELLPIIKTLIPFDNLKNKLIEMIDDLYDVKNSDNIDNKSNIKQLTKLYLNSSSIAEIFPDHILVNIIKYLPSEQFSRLPVLSRNFHNLMVKYPILYRHYKVVIDEIPMYYNTQCIKLLINHSKKSIYIKLADLEVDSVGMEASTSVNSLMFTASFDSKWGGLIPNFSMGNSIGYKSGIKILNPFSVSFPWANIPKWILFCDKWARNTNNNNITINTLNAAAAHNGLSPTMPNTMLTFDTNTMESQHRFNCNIGTIMSAPSFDSNGSVKNFRFVRDIWKTAAPNITTLELENPQKNVIAQLPAEFHKLNHLKFTGTLSDSPSKSITMNRFPNLLYLEFHKIQIDGAGVAITNFLKQEKERYENLNDIQLPTEDEMNEFIGIRARINYRYNIINEILSSFKNLKVFKYYDDGSTINSIEMDLSEWNNNRNGNDINDDIDAPSMHNLHISSSAAITHVKYINKLRQKNGCISFPESVEFISLINCDCLLDFSLCSNIIGLHLYGINYQQIDKWPIHSIIQCLVCSTQSEMTEDWNDIFETNKYRLNNKHRSTKSNLQYISMPSLPITMPTLYSLQSISPVPSTSILSLPVRFMKRITNRTLSPIQCPKLSQNDVSSEPISSEPISSMLERSTSTKRIKSKSSLPTITGMSRIRSAGSNDSNSSYQQEEEKFIVRDNINIAPKIYVENKLNKTKSLNLWNNNIMEEDMDDMNGLNGLNGLGLGDITENFSFPDGNAADDGRDSLCDYDIREIKDDEPLNNKTQKSVIFDVFEEYKKMKYLIDNNKDKELLCLEIEDEAEIFYRLMNTLYFEKPDLLKNKIEIYEKWWDLKIGAWIKHLGKQILPKSQRNII